MPPKALNAPKTLARRKPREITSEYVAGLMAYAEVLYKGGMSPVNKRTSARPETIAALIEVGRDVGLPATQAVAWIMIVNGRPSIWGDAAMALILASGLLESRREWTEGTPGADNYTAYCEVKRIGAKEPRVCSFSIADAKRANLWGKPGPWVEYPERQQMWRAKGWACRDEFPDVLCGLIFTEESLDYPDIASGRVTVEQVEPVSPVIEAPKSCTDEQLDRLAELRDCACTAKGAQTEDEQRAIWAEILAPFQVPSATQLTVTQAETLIEQLGKIHDPFTHGPSSTAS